MSEGDRPEAQDADDEWYKSKMTSFQKWRPQNFKRRRGGMILRGTETNRWTPFAFQFICLGSAVWILFVAVPFQYKDDVLWLLITEAFTFYTFVHVIINWLFLCFTTSTYTPDMNDTPTTNMVADETSTKDTNVKDDVIENVKESTTRPRNQIMLATKVDEARIERRSVPYWSWTDCVVCQTKRPPRCHHCTLCNVCVLKRDHHCYFSRNCVGMYNQRYFVYFLFWCVIFTSLGCYQLLPYIFRVALTDYSYLDLIVPVSVIKAALRQFPLVYCHLVLIMWGGLGLTFLSLVMFAKASYLVLIGVTSFEHESGFKITDTRSISDRVRSVMGENWGVGLMIPGGSSFEFVRSRLPATHVPSKPVEDPLTWPHIKS